MKPYHIPSGILYTVHRKGVLMLPEQLICSPEPLYRLIQPCISNNSILLVFCYESVTSRGPCGDMTQPYFTHFIFTGAFCFYRILPPAPKTLHLREHSPFRHCVYHTCAQKTEWRMTHRTVRPQFTCSLHHFSRKKDIFMCNKRLKHCNPAIVSLSLKFSIDCFDETASSIEPWIDIYSQLI